jgi:hypothetical protein
MGVKREPASRATVTSRFTDCGPRCEIVPGGSHASPGGGVAMGGCPKLLPSNGFRHCAAWKRRFGRHRGDGQAAGGLKS